MLKRLRHLTRAYEHWQQGIGYLKLSRLTSDPNVQERLVRIAQQYRSLAETDVPVGSGFPALSAGIKCGAQLHGPDGRLGR